MKKFIQKIEAFFEGLFSSDKMENFITTATTIVQNIKATVDNPLMQGLLSAIIPDNIETAVKAVMTDAIEGALDTLNLWSGEVAAPQGVEAKVQYFVNWLKDPATSDAVKEAIQAKLAALIAKASASKLGETVDQAISEAAVVLKYYQTFKADAAQLEPTAATPPAQ